MEQVEKDGKILVYGVWTEPETGGYYITGHANSSVPEIAFCVKATIETLFSDGQLKEKKSRPKALKEFLDMVTKYFIDPQYARLIQEDKKEG